MEIRLVPDSRSQYPLTGLLIRGSSPAAWLKEVQAMHVALSSVRIYPVPDVTPNSIWGCFISFHGVAHMNVALPHERVQKVTEHLFIAERSSLYPVVTNEELARLFQTGTYLAHPHIGWVELPPPIHFHELLAGINRSDEVVTRPLPPVPVPSVVRSFQIRPTPPEEVVEKLEKETFPVAKKLDRKPLSTLEKVKLDVYKNIFGDVKGSGDDAQSNTTAGSFFQKLLGKKWKNVSQDIEDLEDRNKKTVDKLLEMLRKDPRNALQYAPPLDQGGETRGGISEGAFGLSQWWSNLGLFGNNRTSGDGGAIDLGNSYYDLQRQYMTTADELVKAGDHKQAAFIYMKLLKLYTKAGETMEAGAHYQEAAAIFLKYANDKRRAAECYEKGSFFDDAIPIYKDLANHEKVGDLYLRKADRNQAMIYYEKVVDLHRQTGAFIKAAELSRNKMANLPRAQSFLLQGWREGKDARNCLGQYFSHIPDSKDLTRAIDNVYHNEVTDTNADSFLQVIKGEYQQKRTDQDHIREMAFVLVDRRMSQNPDVVSELRFFSENNTELKRDVVRYRQFVRDKGNPLSGILSSMQQKSPGK